MDTATVWILVVVATASHVSAATGFCPPGQTKENGTCRDCDSGTFSSGGQCERCAPGFYQPKTGQLACFSCKAGHYQPNAGQLACFPCQAGHFANSAGATSCEPCSAGHFAPRQGAAVCSLCPPGHQQPQAGQSACIPDYIVAMQRNIDDLQDKNKYQQQTIEEEKSRTDRQQDQIKVLQQKIDDQEQKIYDQEQKIETLASQESDVCSTSCVASLQSSTSSLETKASTIERTTSSLQATTSNLEKSINSTRNSLQTQIDGNAGFMTSLPSYVARQAMLSHSFPVGTVVVNGYPVCDDHWDMEDARVACRMFGWSRAVTFTTLNYFNYHAHSGRFSLDNVACTGSESSLYSCSHTSSVNEDCGDGEEAGVICSN